MEEGGGMLIDESHSVVRPEMIGFSPSPFPFLRKHTAVNSRIDRGRRKFAFQIPGAARDCRPECVCVCLRERKREEVKYGRA